MTSEEIKQVSGVVISVLNEHHSVISDSLTTEKAAEEFAARLFSYNVITQPVKDEPSYNKIVKDFIASLAQPLIDNLQGINELCFKFIDALEKVGGPAAKAAKTLKKKWEEQLEHEMNIKLDIGKPIEAEDTSQDTVYHSEAHQQETIRKGRPRVHSPAIQYWKKVDKLNPTELQKHIVQHLKQNGDTKRMDDIISELVNNTSYEMEESTDIDFNKSTWVSNQPNISFAHRPSEDIVLSSSNKVHTDEFEYRTDRGYKCHTEFEDPALPRAHPHVHRNKSETCEDCQARKVFSNNNDEEIRPSEDIHTVEATNSMADFNSDRSDDVLLKQVERLSSLMQQVQSEVDSLRKMVINQKSDIIKKQTNLDCPIETSNTEIVFPKQTVSMPTSEVLQSPSAKAEPENKLKDEIIMLHKELKKKDEIIAVHEELRKKNEILALHKELGKKDA